MAAIALPMWQPAAAQETVTEVSRNKIESSFLKNPKSSLNLNNRIQNSNDEFNPQEKQTAASLPLFPKRGKKSNAPSLKAGGQIYDYYNKTVISGTATDEKLPITASALGRTYSEGQMIYTSTQLGIQNGDQIIAIYFRATASIAASENEDETNSITLRLGKTTLTQLSNSHPEMESRRALMDIVYQGALPTGSNWAKFELTEPYTYTGDNLLVDLQRISGNYAPSVTWYGENQGSRLSPTYASYYYYSTGTGNNTSSGRSRFLPTLVIEYRRAHTGTAETRTVEIKDSTFFAGKDYTWTDAEGTHTSKLTDPATKPEQMIAMVKKIYTDPEIPGNLKRGFATDGSNSGQTNQDVYYNGVCGMTLKDGATSYNSANSYTADDDIYGWGILGTVSGAGSATILYSNGYYYDNGTVYYANMDPNQYKPEKEGLTLLLVELKDTYVDGSNDAIYADGTSYATEYDRLKAYFNNTVKSIRVLTEAKRMGEGLESGTLFKIDCDKMNKFFLLAKGQLNLDHSSAQWWEDVSWINANYSNIDFSLAPHFMHCDLLQYPNQFIDANGLPMFYHMFEQFSPVTSNATQGLDDIYQDLINMNSFGVKHDCIGITGMNHQFLMYGSDSKDADCQDVRDMMFFIPDYRMLDHNGRGTSTQEYHNYHPDLQPNIGLYVIRQNEITATTEADEYYMLNLNWVTNLDEFLPSEDQEFELLQVVVNEETGLEEYVPVYYMNENGEYTDANGVVVETPVPIILQFGAGDEKNYPSVYVARQSSSQQVTYAIRGRDAADATGKHFLSLQISNRQSFIIPGTDPTELVSLIELSHYSRYNPEQEENCYSNRFKLSNNVGGLTRGNMSSAQNTQNIFTFTRRTSATDENPVTIATATVTSRTNSGGTITIQMLNQATMTDFPKAKTGDGYAGYHANPGENNTWTADFTYNKINNVDYVNFGDLVLCDNFVVDVSANAHPNQYIYEVSFNIVSTDDHNFDMAHGSAFHVPIYKTATKINNHFTEAEVRGDMDRSIAIEDLTFSERVQYSSKTEILRNDVYRYTAGETRYIVDKVLGEDSEQDLPPHGIAGNQGEGYTVSMNDVNGQYYYDGGTVAVSAGTAWANFVDYYPASQTDAKAYVYAPVVESFAMGKTSAGAARTDYNTYGGPQQATAIGKLNVTVSQPDVNSETDGYMSTYTWTNDGKKYAYYKVALTINQKDVPSGYNLYKVRAWREVPVELQNEELAIFQADGDKCRMGESVKFEEITYDPTLEYPVAAMDAIDALGVTVKNDVNSASGNPISYTTGTFGAQKVGDGDGEIEELPMTFYVRIYFTHEANLPVAQAQDAPRIMAQDPAAADGKFYVVEAEIPFTITKQNIVTSIDQIATREVAGVKYYNVAGVESDRPFQGVNIVVTRYTDGSMTTTKVVK